MASVALSHYLARKHDSHLALRNRVGLRGVGRLFADRHTCDGYRWNRFRRWILRGSSLAEAARPFSAGSVALLFGAVWRPAVFSQFGRVCRRPSPSDDYIICDPEIPSASLLCSESRCNKTTREEDHPLLAE